MILKDKIEAKKSKKKDFKSIEIAKVGAKNGGIKKMVNYIKFAKNC